MSYFKTQWIVLKPIFGYHFLSKSEKACFSVFPNNLVACCDPCNKHKGSKIPNSRNKQLVHPYFEDFSNVQWLKCKVRRTSPVSFEFFVHRAEELSEVDFERLKNQFVELKLNDLFISNAGRFYATLKPRLERRFHTGGADAVIKELIEFESDEKGLSLNHWKSALFQCLVEDEWFCNEGLLSDD